MNTTEFQLLLLPEHKDNCLITTITADSSNKAATPSKLYKILINLMQQKVVTFVYIKADGNYRQATGTLNEALVPLPLRRNSNPVNTVDGDKQNYFDFGARDFRAFKTNSVVAIIVTD